MSRSNTSTPTPSSSSPAPETGEIPLPALESLIALGPTSPEFATRLRDGLFEYAQRMVLADALTQKPDIDLTDPTVAKKLAARAMYKALELAAELPEGADNVLRATVVHATDQQLHRYHDEEYDTALAMVEAALEGKDRSGSEFSELSRLVTLVIPYMRKNKLPYVEHICARGAKAKSRAMAGYIAGLISNPSLPEAEVTAKVQEALADLANQEVSSREMEKKYRNRTAATPAGENPEPPVPPMQAWDYVEDDGEGYLLIAYNRRQKQLLNAVLQGVTDLHFGTGEENVLEKLRRRRLKPEVEQA